MGISLESPREDLGKSYVELVSQQDLSPQIVHEMYTIEQDIWATFLGEYRSCEDCGNIMSKEDVYSHGRLKIDQEDVKKYTVGEIENILGNIAICCTQCDSDTVSIFGSEFKDEIRSRMDFDESYLVIQRNLKGEMLGFASTYVSDFDAIYEREFHHYYSKIGKDEIRSRVNSVLQGESLDRLLCFAAIGNSPDAANVSNLHTLFRNMFSIVSQESPGLTAIYETVLGSFTHRLLETCYTSRIFIDAEKTQNVNSGVESDIFVHKRMAEQGAEILGSSCNEYIRKHRKTLQEKGE